MSDDFDSWYEDCGPVMPDGFRSGVADSLAPDALALLVAAFHAAGVVFSPGSAQDRQLRAELGEIALIRHSPPTRFRVEDPTSKRYLDEIDSACNALLKALRRAQSYVSQSQADAPSEKVNTAAIALKHEIYDRLRFDIIAAKVEIGLARKSVYTPSRRPKLWLYYFYVQRLQQVYRQKVGGRGFAERDGTAAGPFVQIVHTCQAILPRSYRHTDIRTTGNRVLHALTEEIPSLFPNKP